MDKRNTSSRSAGRGYSSMNVEIPPPQEVKFLYDVKQGFPLWARWERFLAGFLPLTALLLGLLVWRPEWHFWFNIGYCFLLGLWLPISQLINPLEDTNQYRDMLVVMILSFGAFENMILASVAFIVVLLFLQGFVQGALDGHMLGTLLGVALIQLFIGAVLAWIGYFDWAFWQDFRLGFTLPAVLFALFVGWFLGSALGSEARS